MRRPHVYERSTIRAAQGYRPAPVDDFRAAAKATIAAVPDLLRQVETAGAVTLARYLGQTLNGAEGIGRRGMRRCKARRRHSPHHGRYPTLASTSARTRLQ